MDFNGELADAVLSLIDAEPEQWNQGDWASPVDGRLYDLLFRRGMVEEYGEADEPVTVCGARLCFAGHAALLAGWMLIRDPFENPKVVNPHGEVKDIEEAAAYELGFDTEGCSEIMPVLFGGMRTREELGILVDLHKRGGDDADARVALYYDNCFPTASSDDDEVG